MARLTDEMRERIVNLWRCGESQNSLAKRFPVSVATINKLCKGVPQDNAEIVNAQVQINQLLSQKVNTEVNAINQMVEEKTVLGKFFRDSAVKNQHLSNNKIDDLNSSGDGLSLNDLEAHSRITARNKETVLGKSPDTAIQVNNNEAPRLVIQSNAVRD
jgi:hypothetical protein